MPVDFESLSFEDIRDDILKFNNDPYVQELENFYNAQSFSEILGVSRRELSHSSFIAWILDSQRNQGLSFYPFQKFLEILVNFSKEDQTEQHKELFDHIVVGAIEIEEVNVEPEFRIAGVGRPDIFISSTVSFKGKKERLAIVIENKVGAKETYDQTLRYYEHFRLDQSGTIYLYVYLTPISNIDLKKLQEPQCACKNFIQINYQTLVTNLIEPTLQRNISEKTRVIINEYLLSLSQPALAEKSENNSQTNTPNLIMALGTRERELLKLFFQKHERLIEATLYAISIDETQDEETRAVATRFLEQAPRASRASNTYTIKYNGENWRSFTGVADIGRSTVQLFEEKGLLNEDSFQFLKEDRSCGLQLLKTFDEITQGEKDRNKYQHEKAPVINYNGSDYYVARNWNGLDGESGDIFSAKINAKYPAISFEVSKPNRD